MMRLRLSRAGSRWLAVLLVMCLLGCSSACSFFGYKSLRLETTIINDANRLLTLQGKTNLPDGVAVAANIGENGQVLKRTQAAVHEGQYCLLLDVSDMEGNTRYDLEVFTQATLWDDSQKAKFGERGEFMVGRQVEELGDGFKLAEHFVVVLPMAKREAAIRRIKNGDYAYGVANLESIVEEDSHDDQAVAWLALALIHNNQAERHIGSRAYDLLHAAKIEKLPKSLRQQCEIWLERWNAEEEDIRARKERQDAIAYHRSEAKRRLGEIVPGKRMADISIGMDSKRLFSVCPLRTPLDWNEEIVEFSVPERKVVVYIDSATRKVVEVATSSADLRLAGDLGVGSDMVAIMERFPGGTMSWEEIGMVKGSAAKGAVDDVVEVSKGEYSHPSGVVFGVRRESLALGLNVDTVTSVSILAPQ